MSQQIESSLRRHRKAPRPRTGVWRIAAPFITLLAAHILTAQETPGPSPPTEHPAANYSIPSLAFSDAPSAVAVQLGPAAVPSDKASPAATSAPVVITRPALSGPEQRNNDCEDGNLRGRPCRVDWKRVLAESFFFLSAQHGGNILMDADTRFDLTHGSFWGDYASCVRNYRWSRWKDDDPFGVDYIGHPMMGALTNSIYEQNDPKQRALTLENSRRYWMGHLRATAYSAAYSAQWKIGPLSEASIGNTGIGYYVRKSDGLVTNETGMQDFFVTPIGGLAWNIGEDAMDRFFIARVRSHTRNRLVLFLASFTTPGKSAANLSRFRAPYYRDRDASIAGALVR